MAAAVLTLPILIAVDLVDNGITLGVLLGVVLMVAAAIALLFAAFSAVGLG